MKKESLKAKNERLQAMADSLSMRLGREMLAVARLQCEGTFSLQRDPFDLMPAIDAYAAEEISSGKMRECVRRWLAGENFRDKATRDWEKP